MKRQKQSRIQATFLLLTGFLMVTLPLKAQERAPSGISGSGEGYWASKRLGGGQGVGAGGAIIIGASPRVSLEPSWMRVLDIQADGSSDPRRYDLDIASVALRARLAGRDNGLDLLIGAGALVHRLEASGGSPKETKTIPFFSPGLAIRQHLAGPLYFEMSARAPMLWTRENELSATPGNRKFGVGADLRAGLAFLIHPRRSEPKALPVETSEGFQPVEPVARASATPAPVRTNTAATGTRYLTTFYFDENSFEVKQEYREALQKLSQYLLKNPTVVVDLIGFTENRNDRNATKQQVLAESRGTNLKELLVRVYGAPPGRIDVSSVGADFDTPNAQLARRVEAIARIQR